MTQDQHDGNARAKFTVHRSDVVDLHALENLLRRHPHEFCAAKQIRAQTPKMPADEATQFARRFFIAKGNRDIAFRKPPILARHQPRATAEQLPKSEQKA